MHIEFTQANRDHATELLDLINSQQLSPMDQSTLLAILDNSDSMILIAEDEDEQKLVACVCLNRTEARCNLDLWTLSKTVPPKSLEELMMSEALAFADFWDCKEVSIKQTDVSPSLKIWCSRNNFCEITNSEGTFLTKKL